MSRVYFHHRTGEAELRGAERHWLASLVSRTFMAGLGDVSGGFSGDSWVKPLINPDHYASKMRGGDALDTVLRIGDMGGGSPLLLHPETKEPIDIFTAQLNTALRWGSDPIRLAARIHGQCEIHSYVMPEDFGWFCGIVEEGLRDNLFRTEMGWDTVVSFIRALPLDQGPVVLSCSVCEQFPWSGVLGEDDDEDGERWEAVSHEEAWDAGIKWLEDVCHGTLRIQPTNFQVFGFGDGMDAMQLRELATKQTARTA